MQELPPLKRSRPKPVRARVLRLLLERRDAGLEIDPWLPFPQKHCCFSFGPLGGPVPVGALFLLWSAGPPWAQTCPDCRNTAYMVSFGGFLSWGGGHLVCPACGEEWFQWLGGLASISRWLNASPIAKGEYRPKGMRYGGAFCSEGEELRQLLGVTGPPDEEEGVSLTTASGTAFSVGLGFETVAPGKKA